MFLCISSNSIRMLKKLLSLNRKVMKKSNDIQKSKKRYYFRSFCRFSSLVRRESQASMIPSTIMTSSRHSIFAQTSLSLAESDLPKVPASRSLEYCTMPPGSQCRSFIRSRFMKIYTLPLQGSCPMASVMIPLRVWKLLRISVGRLYNR